MKRLTFALAIFLVAFAVPAENISVATVDVWSGLADGGVFRVRDYENSAARQFRYDLLVDGLQDLSPDIIALQDANPLPSYANTIAADLGYDAVFATRQAGVRIGPVGFPTNLREGIVTLSPPGRTLEEVRTQRLSGSGAGNVASFQFGPASIVTASRVTVAEREVFVFNTRWTPSPFADRAKLNSLVEQYDEGEIDGGELVLLMRDAVTGSDRRLLEAERTLVFINELAGQAPVILIGSFHALPGSDEIALLRDAGFVDVWQAVGRGAGLTYDPVGNINIKTHGLSASGTAERIDYIFIRGADIAARSARLIFNRPTYGVFASDHYGIYAELRVDPAN